MKKLMFIMLIGLIICGFSQENIEKTIEENNNELTVESLLDSVRTDSLYKADSLAKAQKINKVVYRGYFENFNSTTWNNEAFTIIQDSSKFNPDVKDFSELYNDFGIYTYKTKQIYGSIINVPVTFDNITSSLSINNIRTYSMDIDFTSPIFGFESAEYNLNPIGSVFGSNLNLIVRDYMPGITKNTIHFAQGSYDYEKFWVSGQMSYLEPLEITYAVGLRKFKNNKNFAGYSSENNGFDKGDYSLGLAYNLTRKVRFNFDIMNVNSKTGFSDYDYGPYYYERKNSTLMDFGAEFVNDRGCEYLFNVRYETSDFKYRQDSTQIVTEDSTTLLYSSNSYTTDLVDVLTFSLRGNPNFKYRNGEFIIEAPSIAADYSLFLETHSLLDNPDTSQSHISILLTDDIKYKGALIQPAVGFAGENLNYGLNLKYKIVKDFNVYAGFSLGEDKFTDFGFSYLLPRQDTLNYYQNNSTVKSNRILAGLKYEIPKFKTRLFWHRYNYEIDNSSSTNYCHETFGYDLSFSLSENFFLSNNLMYNNLSKDEIDYFDFHTISSISQLVYSQNFFEDRLKARAYAKFRISKFMQNDDNGEPTEYFWYDYDSYYSSIAKLETVSDMSFGVLFNYIGFEVYGNIDYSLNEKYIIYKPGTENSELDYLWEFGVNWTLLD